MILVHRLFVQIVTLNFARAITLWPFIVLKEDCLRDDPYLMNHEKIHLEQQKELLVVGFYVFYVLEYLLRRLQYGTHLLAYLNISFEREAFENEDDLDYLKKRKRYSVFKKRYFRRRKKR